MLIDMTLEELKKYKPPQTKKGDFIEFWQETKAISQDQPLNIEIKKIDYFIKIMMVTEVVEYVDITSFQNYLVRIL